MFIGILKQSSIWNYVIKRSFDKKYVYDFVLIIYLWTNNVNNSLPNKHLRVVIKFR